MESEQIEQLKKLVIYWREPHIGTGDANYDLGKDAAYHSCADALEEVLQSSNKDEETE